MEFAENEENNMINIVKRGLSTILKMYPDRAGGEGRGYLSVLAGAEVDVGHVEEPSHHGPVGVVPDQRQGYQHAAGVPGLHR